MCMIYTFIHTVAVATEKHFAAFIMTLQLVKGKRSRAKTSLTLQHTFAQGINENTSLFSLEIHLMRLTEAWSDLKEMSDNMYEFVDLERFVDPETEFVQYEEKYLLTHAAIIGAIRKKSPTPPSPDINIANLT